jgi:two-component system OmpR family sensor kinase
MAAGSPNWVAASSSAKDWIEFRVTDTGDGIPESERVRIFDKYAQVDPGGLAEKQGSGLGLTICQAFIGAHGGTIGVDSSTGESSGSSFWFRLPREI